MAKSLLRKRASFTWLSALSSLALGGGLLLGCGAEGTVSDVELEQGAVLGGTSTPNPTLIQEGILMANLCSGALLDQNTAISATHCSTLSTPSANDMTAFTPSGIKTRPVVQVVQVGTSDVTLFKLGGAIPAGWPSVNRTVSSLSGASAVGTEVTCYGRGDTGYAPGGGFTGGGSFRHLTRVIGGYNPTDNYLWFPSFYGWDVLAPGDSGGLCLTGNAAVGVTWKGTIECAPGTPPANCNKSNATKVLEAHLSSLNKYKAYIEATKTRAMTTFVPMTLSTTWKSSPFSTHVAGAALVNGFVYLRGAVSAGSSGTLFTLPAGYRPSHKVYLPINLVDSKKGRLIIETSGVVTVNAESGSLADAYKFTSLDGASFAVSSTPSTAATMLNGWGNTTLGTRPVAARADGNVIRLQGAMATAGTTVTAFTLHSSFWPSTRVLIPVDMNNGTKGRIVIEPNGTGWVSVESGKPASNGFLFTSLEGVAYNKSSGGDAVALYNGWGVYPGLRTPTVANRNGIVKFQGALATTGTNMAAMYIPEQYRPATDIYVQVDLCNAKKGRVLVQPSGWVSVQYQSAIGDAQCLTSLEGVQYGL